MTYQQTLNWMFSRLPMFQQVGRSALHHKLDNSVAFAERLSYPHRDFRSIHIAGTNGKGSSSHMLASVLQEAGYKVGLYTSPHLKDFRERIKINGELISEQEVVEFIAEHRTFLEEKGLSFFEMTVGLAFHHFARHRVDIAVIEVGLGGRYDSTNIITPEISLITNIGKDHQDILGDTLAQIALEKSGIIKMGIPVVVSEYQTEVAEVFMQEVQRRQTNLVFASQQISDIELLPSDLKGIYQRKNIKGVMAVVKILADRGWNISRENLQQGLLRVKRNTGFQGRWYQMGEAPVIICDTAHNEPGIDEVTEQLSQQTYRQLHLVLGFVRDKKVQAILKKFPQKACFYWVSPAVARGLPVRELQQKAQEIGLQGEVYSSVKEGLLAAQKNASTDDFIYVGGSTFVVAEVVD